MTILLVLLSLLMGSAFAFVLYFKEKKSALDKKSRLLLAVLRGLSITMIGLLLSSFFINKKVRIVEKPIIVIVNDNSSSITQIKDSAYFKSDFKTDVDALRNNLSAEADVFVYEFDSEFRNDVSFLFDGEQSNLYQALENVLLRYENRNIAGLILISDGIVNTGNDPLMLTDQFWFPVHTIALGDTTKYADALIKDLRYNKTAGLGNKFPVEVVIQANYLNGQNTILSVTQNGKEVHRKEISYTSDNYAETITFMFEAYQKGLNRIEFNLLQSTQEENIVNNFAAAVIEIVERKNKVGIIYHSPHPDISAIKSAIDIAGNMEAETIQLQSLNKNEIDNYQAFIICQLPDRKAKSETLTQLLQSDKPYFLIVGQNTDLKQLNALNIGIGIQQTSQLTQEALPAFNSAFSLFQVSIDAIRSIGKFPPLITHYATYRFAETFHVLLYQKIGSVQTSVPLLAFSAEKGKFRAILVGEGLYKWKLFNFFNYQNHLVFNELIQKSMNFLVQQSDKRKLRIHHKDVYFSTENAEMTAEVYNMSMEMTTNHDVFIVIKSHEGDQRDMMFTPQINNYKLNPGKLKPGKYTWAAHTFIDNEKISESGMFFVDEMNLEKMNLTANHNVLKTFSAKSQGLFFNKNQIQNASDEILKNSQLNSVEYLQESSDEMISLKWLLFILIVFLSAEWAARKYLGTY